MVTIHKQVLHMISGVLSQPHMRGFVELWFEKHYLFSTLLEKHCSSQLLTVYSRLQTPSSHKERGLVTIEQFLGCAESAKCH